MEDKISRRHFLKLLAGAGATLYGIPFTAFGQGEKKIGKGRGLEKSTSNEILVVAEGKDPKEMTLAAIDALGGMGKWVRRRDVVVVKPNIAWDRVPEQAANTNPQIISALIELCLNAGASQVKVLDRTCNDQRRTYERSGIAGAAREAGAVVSFVDDRTLTQVAIPRGKSLKSWRFYREALEADVFINVPIAKHHSAAGLTMGIKNIMGILGDDRGRIHHGIHQNLADLNTVVKIDLTVLDAFRILIANGPQGGRLEDVRNIGQIVAGTDRVAVDAYGATLFEPFGVKAEALIYIKNAHELGLGEMNLEKVKIKRISVA